MNAFSKVTLYDMLAIFIPGFLLLLLLTFVFNIQLPFAGSDIVSVILVFVASYITGLIYHKLMEQLLSGCFRNSSSAIKTQAEKFYEGYNKDRKQDENDKVKKEYSRHEYYKAYYVLMKNNCLNSIPTLEAQVVFIRNMLPIILLYIIALCCSCKMCRLPESVNSCALAIVLFITEFILIYLMVNIQNKIYSLVWEGAQYLNDINAPASPTGTESDK
jgi:hypothetical protein